MSLDSSWGDISTKATGTTWAYPACSTGIYYNGDLIYTSNTTSSWHSRSKFSPTDVNPTTSSTTCPETNNTGSSNNSHCISSSTCCWACLRGKLTQGITLNADNLSPARRFANITDEPIIFVAKAEGRALVRRENKRAFSTAACLSLRPPYPASIAAKPYPVGYTVPTFRDSVDRRATPESVSNASLMWWNLLLMTQHFASESS